MKYFHNLRMNAFFSNPYIVLSKPHYSISHMEMRVLKSSSTPLILRVPKGGTVVGFKLSGHFKFFFDIINVRVTFLDAKGPIK